MQYSLRIQNDFRNFAAARYADRLHLRADAGGREQDQYAQRREMAEHCDLLLVLVQNQKVVPFYSIPGREQLPSAVPPIDMACWDRRRVLTWPDCSSSSFPPTVLL